ncbi:MAG TPA: hypothetical protein VHD87_01735 [Acidimicrobiales bacterium]|nr:hypothetical protein [Acidimicrobiales bacterium]
MAPLLNRPAGRDRTVVNYLRRELYPHSEAARTRISEAGIVGGQFRSLADLKAVSPVGLDELDGAADYVLRPTRQGLIRSGRPYLRFRTFWASTWGRWDAFLRAIEPLYRPVHFFNADGVPLGASAADLVRLAGIGTEWLRALGVTRADAVALVGGASSGIEAWELSGGTRRAGVSLAVLDDPAAAARHAVSIVAGTEAGVLAALANGTWPALRLAVVLASNGDAVAQRLAQLGATDRVALRLAAAVPGTRSVWFECRGGAEYGWHTTPEAEYVEVDEHQEVVWTGLGWAGTVLLRLRTDVRAERIDDTPCAACGHQGSRVFLAHGRASLARWLHADPRVADWRLTPTGAEVLPTRAGANAKLVNDAKKVVPDHPLTVKTKKAWGDA